MLLFCCLQLVFHDRISWIVFNASNLLNFGTLVGLLEVELPPGSGVSWNCSTECCQFH